MFISCKMDKPKRERRKILFPQMVEKTDKGFKETFIFGGENHGTIFKYSSKKKKYYKYSRYTRKKGRPVQHIAQIYYDKYNNNEPKVISCGGDNKQLLEFNFKTRQWENIAKRYNISIEKYPISRAAVSALLNDDYIMIMSRDLMLLIYSIYEHKFIKVCNQLDKITKKIQYIWDLGLVAIDKNIYCLFKDQLIITFEITKEFKIKILFAKHHNKLPKSFSSFGYSKISYNDRDYILIVGGFRQNTIYVYDIKKERVYLSPLYLPMNIWQCGAVVHGKYLHIIGGETNQHKASGIYKTRIANIFKNMDMSDETSSDTSDSDLESHHEPYLRPQSEPLMNNLSVLSKSLSNQILSMDNSNKNEISLPTDFFG